MGAFRESFSIRNYWRGYREEKLTYRLKSLYILIFKRFIFGRKWERKYFLKDNFITPYYQKIGCKISPHKFFYDDEDDEYFCTRCSFKVKGANYKNYTRTEKLKKLF